MLVIVSRSRSASTTCAPRIKPGDLQQNFTMHETHTHVQPFNGPLSGSTQVGRYQKKHSPTYTHPGHQTSFINFLHLLRSTASSLFSLWAWQSLSTTSLQVLFGLPIGLGPSTSYSMHFTMYSHLFATHAHTITACSAVMPRLCHTSAQAKSSCTSRVTYLQVSRICKHTDQYKLHHKN